MGVIICSFNLSISPKTSYGVLECDDIVTELHAYDFVMKDFVIKRSIFVPDPKSKKKKDSFFLFEYNLHNMKFSYFIVTKKVLFSKALYQKTNNLVMNLNNSPMLGGLP